MPQTRQQLMEDIVSTKYQISELKKEIKATTDEKEKRRLKRRLKELQYLQLWRFDLLKWWEK